MISTAALLSWHAPQYPRTVKALFTVLSLVARPPHFLVTLRPMQARLVSLRALQAVAMAAVASRYGARTPSALETAALLTTTGCGAALVLLRAVDQLRRGPHPSEDGYRPFLRHPARRRPRATKEDECEGWRVSTEVTLGPGALSTCLAYPPKANSYMIWVLGGNTA